MCEENGGHLSLKFPWTNQSAGVKDMLMFNIEIRTLLKLLPGPLRQGLCCSTGLIITSSHIRK